MVAAADALASQAGVQAMMAGGNAVDAAIATAAALGVVEPQNSGVGGDGFILIYWAETGAVVAVNATGPAPRAATRDLYLESGGIPMKGMRSVSVPGIVDGWLLAHARYGALALEQVLEPAVALCEEGFPVGHKLAARLKGELAAFAADPDTRAVFTRDGAPFEPGDILVQKNLGTTLRRIAAEGRAVLYEGDIARAVVEYSRAHDGLFGERDLGEYHAHWADPATPTTAATACTKCPPTPAATSSCRS